MDKAKVSIIQAVAMSKANLTLDNDYLSAAYKALKWECNQADTFRDLYLAFSDDVRQVHLTQHISLSLCISFAIS